MKFLFTLFLIAISPAAWCQFCFLPPDVESSFNESLKGIKPAHANWVRGTATRASDGNLDPGKIQEEARQYAGSFDLNDGDIEALVFLVMMQTSKEAQEDLKDLLAEMKEINEKKAKLRRASEALKSGNKIRYNSQLDSLKLASGLVKQQPKPIRAVAIKPISRSELETAIQEMDKENDSLSELGEMKSLQIQIYMDRVSKIHSLLSSLMKKFSATSSTIISNLK